jgi:drug/metabolite transporter (DMT)-like permease
VLVVTSSLMYALHAALSKRYAGAIGLTDFFFFRLFFTTVFLIPIAAGRGALVSPSPTAWALLALVGTVDVVLSRTLYYLALRRLTMSMHTIALTLSPIAAILWAFLIFATLPTVQQLLGGAAILAGVLIVTVGRSKATRED